MSDETIFDQCIAEAIQIARKHLNPESLINVPEDKPTHQEWELALILFQRRFR